MTVRALLAHWSCFVGVRSATQRRKRYTETLKHPARNKSHRPAATHYHQKRRIAGAPTCSASSARVHKQPEYTLPGDNTVKLYNVLSMDMLRVALGVDSGPGRY